MFFSVLIPVYNTSKYLPECMQSVLSQSFKDFEVVLLDDGSKDNSGLLCDEYAKQDPRVRVIHKSNEGLMMTRRRGFMEAKGDFFICIDSDDKLLSEQAFEIIHRIILETECDLVLYNYTYGEGKNRTEIPRVLFDYPTGFVFDASQKVELYNKLLTTNHMNNIWIKCSSRRIVDISVDYSVWKQEICRAEDLFQSYPIIDQAKRIAYINESLYYYRWSEGSISNSFKFKYYNAMRCIYNREDDYIIKWNLPDSIIEKTKRQRISSIADIVQICYFQCKAKKALPEWKRFLLYVSDDSFFISIFDECNSEKVLKYYKILHYLIIKKRFNMTALLIESTTLFQKIKHTSESNNVNTR